MTIKQGSIGNFSEVEDFVGAAGQPTWIAGVGTLGKIAYTSVNEGSFAVVTDEPGGVITVTTDTADNDNFVGFVGMFKPADGAVWMEARLKVGNVAATQTAVNAGFYSVLAMDTPVLAFESATGTLTRTGTSLDGAVMFFDTDDSTITWRAATSKAGAASGDTNGTDSGVAPVNDRWDVVRVELLQDGTARMHLNGKLIKETASAVTTTDTYFAVVGIENRAGGGEVLELDYFAWGGSRDWDDA